jgi:serine/threonine-protein kinase
MAVVYRAKDINLERFVAVKILRPDFSKDEGFRKRFHQEAKAAANLSHPNIVTVHDFGLEGEQLFIIMEYIPGTHLKKIIQEREKLSIEEGLDILIQASAGIGYAHRAGIVHCDVKPHNILVAPDKRVKVTDFGIARALASIQPDEKSNIVWGSPQYLSPEQANGEAPSPASDVYSLGVVMYETLTGKLPFYSKDANQMIKLHLESQPVSPRKINPDIPKPLEQIILKVLSKEPSSRYRTADQLSRVLENFRKQMDSGVFQNSVYPLPTTPQPPVNYSINQFEDHRQSPSPFPTRSSPDWGTILLGLLAFLLAGGLIPFWLFIWFTFN